MAVPPRFIDDQEVVAAVTAAAKSAADRLSDLLPELCGERREQFERTLFQDIRDRLSERSEAFPPLVLGDDAFGDRFDLSELPLARKGTGYAVQRLDTDQLLDRTSGAFLPVRHPSLQGLFETFDAAFAEAKAWLITHRVLPDEHPLAIVPAYFDDRLHRHVLIYGVLTRSP